MVKVFGFFLITGEMIFMRKKEICVWVSSDIFAN